MRIYATRRQCEQIIISLMATFGSTDEEVLKLISNINAVLLTQCKHDKKRYIPTTTIDMPPDKEEKK